jgi:hypothetical protein
MNMGRISITSVSKNLSISHQELNMNIKQKPDSRKMENEQKMKNMIDGVSVEQKER